MLSEHPGWPSRKKLKNPINHPFRTSSGKIEIYSRKIAEMQNSLIPPVPKYMEPWEGPRDPLTKDFPFQLVSPHSLVGINSSLDNIPRLKARADDDLGVNPGDAADLGVQPGEKVRLSNERGEMIRKVKVTYRIMSGVVSLDAGSWYSPMGKGWIKAAT